MADPQPSTARVGRPMPPFAPQNCQGTAPLPLYPSFSHNPSAPQGFATPGQVHQQPQQHPSNFGGRFPGTLPPWTGYGLHGYGFHGLPPSYGPHVPLLGGISSGPLTKSLSGITISAQNTTGPPGTEFGQQRNSFGIAVSQNVPQVTSLGQSRTLPPGVGSGPFRAASGIQLSQDIPGVTSSDQITYLSQGSGSAVQIWNSNSGVAPTAIPQGRGVVGATLSSAVANGRSTDSEFTYENHQSVNVVEQAMLQARNEKVGDLKDVLLQIRSLVSQVERTAEQVGRFAKIDLCSKKSLTVACPFDRAHKIVPEGLFQHYLRCPSNPKRPLDAQFLMESLRYRRSIQGDGSSDISNRVDSSRGIIADVTGGIVPSLRTEPDIWGGQFFYKGASAVVQAPLCTVHPPQGNCPPSPVSEVPRRLSTKFESADALRPGLSRESFVSGDALVLLPSQYFFLSKEIQAWEDLPSRSSSVVMEAAVGLGRVRKPTVVNWLLINSTAHGIVIDSALACHIYSFVKACFLEVRNEASALLDRADYRPVAVKTTEGLNDSQHLQTRLTSCNLSQFGMTADAQSGTSKGGDTTVHMSFCPQMQLIDCPKVFRSLEWLSAQLCPLYGSLESKKFSLSLLKHSVASSARLLSSPLIDTFDRSNYGARRSKVEEEGNGGKVFIHNLENERTHSTFVDPHIFDGVSSTESGGLGNSSSRILELEAAVAAVNERALLEFYWRTPPHANRLLKFQLIQEYDAAVQRAAEERMRRPNYRPVVECDGLIWHRSQLEEKNKNKTREEILAEERDYKRRRMSYRGKKLKRTPTQVVRDIIEGHMEEIMAAGGIGCFIKQSVQVPPAAIQQIKKGDISLGSNESRFADGEQLKMSASDSSSIGRAVSSLHVHERGLREHSHSHSEPQKCNERLRLSSKKKDISKAEICDGRETDEEQYSWKASDSAARYSKFGTTGEESRVTGHDGGKDFHMNYRSTSEDYRDSSRVGSEASNLRSPSHGHRQIERYAMKRSRTNGKDMCESHGHDEIRDNKPYRGYRQDSREDQGSVSVDAGDVYIPQLALS